MSAILSPYAYSEFWLPFEGANNGVVFTDYSRVVKTMTYGGNVNTNNGTSKFYGTSAYFDGSADYIRCVDNGCNFGTLDFTIDFWVYMINGGHGSSWARIAESAQYNTTGGWTIACTSSDNPAQIAFHGTSNGVFHYQTNEVIPNNTWTHIAICRKDSILRLFINGVVKNTVNPFTYNFNQNKLSIGSNNGGSESFYGRLQDFRIFKGLGLYGAAGFTPPGQIISSLDGIVHPPVGDRLDHEIAVFPRCWPTRVFTTKSSAIDGSYSFPKIPSTEYCRVALNRGSIPRSDIISRIVVE